MNTTIEFTEITKALVLGFQEGKKWYHHSQFAEPHYRKFAAWEVADMKEKGLLHKTSYANTYIIYSIDPYGKKKRVYDIEILEVK